ncbi:hypothetical protein XENORESO_020787 [Xenotaenia resolanae]|uniref:Uncharacterized protein n=1 Tax=Xenotaenia resolanae TaxID=208358 RepID=A0ABV0WRZ2_9TELE
MVHVLFSNSKPSLSKNSPSLTQRSIHLAVHPPTSPSSHSGTSLQKKGTTPIGDYWNKEPANPRLCGEGLTPTPSSSNHQLSKSADNTYAARSNIPVLNPSKVVSFSHTLRLIPV